MKEYLNVLWIFKKFWGVVFFLIISATQAAEKNFSLDDLEKYLQKLVEIKSDFEQIDKNVISKGNFYLNKPKKFMQMIYEAPASLEITLKNKKLIYYDRELKERTETSAHSSPFSFLLKNKVDLKKELQILNVQIMSNNQLRVKLCKKSGDDGAMMLIFNKNPLSLVGWIIFEDKNDESYQKSVEIRLINPKIKSN